jgi:hypothetical protein
MGSQLPNAQDIENFIQKRYSNPKKLNTTIATVADTKHSRTTMSSVDPNVSACLA